MRSNSFKDVFKMTSGDNVEATQRNRLKGIEQLINLGEQKLE